MISVRQLALARFFPIPSNFTAVTQPTHNHTVTPASKNEPPSPLKSNFLALAVRRVFGWLAQRIKKLVPVKPKGQHEQAGLAIHVCRHNLESYDGTVDTKNCPPGDFIYTVEFEDPLHPDIPKFVKIVECLAKKETLRIGAVDDLELLKDHSMYGDLEYRFTHALEHLVFANLWDKKENFMLVPGGLACFGRTYRATIRASGKIKRTGFYIRNSLAKQDEEWTSVQRVLEKLNLIVEIMNADVSVDRNAYPFDRHRYSLTAEGFKVESPLKSSRDMGANEIGEFKKRIENFTASQKSEDEKEKFKKVYEGLLWIQELLH